MTNGQSEGKIHPQSLPRVLGLFDATAMVIGSVIGSGIFLKVGNVDKALMAWGFLPIISVWIFVGIITLAGSLSLAELAAMYPQAGGPYLYLREAYGRLIAFLWGWTEFWVVRTGSVGALACATVIYLDEFLTDRSSSTSQLGHFGQMGVAIAIIAGLTLVNMYSTRLGAGVQNLATVTKLTFLAMIIFLPLFMGKVQLSHLNPLWTTPTETVSEAVRSSQPEQTVPAPGQSLLQAFGIAMIAVFWPYDGWINIAPVAEDIREPQRNLPLALALGIAAVALVYISANFSYHLVLSMPTVANSNRLAADLFRELIGEWGAKIAAIGVCCSTFGAVSANLITGPRIYLAAARDGLVPSLIQKIHPKYQTPINSVLLQGIWSCLLIVAFYSVSEHPKQVFDLMTDAVICAGLIFYSLAVGAVYILRIRNPHATRPYRTWGYPVTPALLIGSYLIALIATLRQQSDKLAWVLALIVAGIVFYYLKSSKTPKNPAESDQPTALS